VTRAGRLPIRGDIVPGPGLFEFEVLDADPRRVKRVRITRLKERRDYPREPRRRGEPDAMDAGGATAVPGSNDQPASKGADSEAGTRRP